MRTYKIELLLVRHGYSCANIVRDTIGSTDLSHGILLPSSTYAPDSVLSDHGIQQVHALRQSTVYTDNLQPVHVVFASELIRAIETAAILFGNDKTIHVMPCINESRDWLFELFDLDTDNSSLGLANTKKHIEGKFRGAHIDYEFLVAYKQGRDTIEHASVERFFDTVLPRFVATHPLVFDTKRTTKMCMVSHYKFITAMLEHLGATNQGHITNTATYRVMINLELDDEGKYIAIKPHGDVVRLYPMQLNTHEHNKAKQLDLSGYARCGERLAHRLESIPVVTRSGGGGYNGMYVANKAKYIEL
jgi:broad specificity phosphatase PhoE